MTFLVLFLLTTFMGPAQRKEWSIPTYTVEIRGEGLVRIEGSYETPDGEITAVKPYDSPLPTNFYVNANCQLRLKITGTDRFTVTAFYEYRTESRWLNATIGMADIPVTIDLPPNLHQAKQVAAQTRGVGTLQRCVEVAPGHLECAPAAALPQQQPTMIVKAPHRSRWRLLWSVPLAGLMRLTILEKTGQVRD